MPRLSDLAKHVVAPKGMVSTGWPAVVAKCAAMGIRFRPWQPGAGRLILAKRADGKYAATIGGTGISICRQTGKTFLVGAIVFALCLLRPSLTVIWTAHRLRTSEETFGKMQAFAKRKKIWPHILKIVLGSGDEAILFRNRSRILFGARERGFGRGFDEVDVLIFDEAQILTGAALDDMVPAMNQSRQPEGGLMLFMGTPPKPTDPSEVFVRMRQEALSGEDDDTGWIEFGADEDHKFTPLPTPLTAADWKQIEKANPSFPADTPRESILRMRKKLGSDSFLHEGAGVWDDPGALAPSEVDFAKWDALGHTAAPMEGRVAYAVRFSADGSRVALAAAVRPAVGVPHVELVKVRNMSAGTGWLVEFLSARWSGASRITVDGKAGAGALVNALRLAKVPARVIHTPTVDEVIAAHSMVAEAIRSASLSHFSQKPLDDAVRGAGKRTIGKAGGWGWRPLSPDVDVTPLDAVTLVLHAVATGKSGAGRTGISRRATVL